MDARQTLGEPRVLISQLSLLQNVALLRRSISSQTRICAIVKADAYGHGAALVANILADAVDAFAVADIGEADALPPTDLPILVLRPVENAYLGRQRARLEAAIQNGWHLTVCSPAAADDLARVAITCNKRANVQVMLDTGMSRAGADIDELPRLIERITELPSLRLTGINSHFACADEPGHAFSLRQLQQFNQATASLAQSQAGSRIIRHIANSGGLFFIPDSHLDMVRPGISLYGIDPIGRPCLDRTLRPVMEWTAPLIGIRQVAPGATVGYGQSWQATTSTRVGLVPVGYADGYLRCFSNRAVMMVHGQPAPVIGRVSMDLTTIDLSKIPHATVGDEVTVLDSDPLSPASVYQLAKLAGTIPYEIFTHIGPRVRRVGIDLIDNDPEPHWNEGSGWESSSAQPE